MVFNSHTPNLENLRESLRLFMLTYHVSIHGDVSVNPSED